MKAVPTIAGAAVLLLAPAFAAPSRLIRRDNAPGLINGDFETGQLDPWIAEPLDPEEEYPTPYQIVSPGYNSNYALSMGPVTASECDAGVVLQRIYADFNTNYLISAQYKVTDAPADGSCNVTFKANDVGSVVNFAEARVPMVVGDWTPISVQYGNFAPVDGEKFFYLTLGVECPSGLVQWDAITMQATGTLEPASCPGNALVPNGDFESGSYAPWEELHAEEWADAATIVSPGENSAYAFAFSFPPGSTRVESEISQGVPNVCFNYYYNVEFDVNWVDVSAQTDCELSFLTKNCGDSDNTDLTVKPDSNGWSHQSISCTSTRDTVYLTYSMYCFGGGPTGAYSVQIDNVQLNLVGGPAPPSW